MAPFAVDNRGKAIAGELLSHQTCKQMAKWPVLWRPPAADRQFLIELARLFIRPEHALHALWLAVHRQGRRY